MIRKNIKINEEYRNFVKKNENKNGKKGEDERGR